MSMNMNASDMMPGLARTMILDAPFEVCPNCGGKYFKEVMMFKKISKIQAATPEDILFPIPVYVCDKCGEIAPSYKEDKKFQELIGSDDNSVEDVTIIK